LARNFFGSIFYSLYIVNFLISASFNEPFYSPDGISSRNQRKFTGDRFSDHVAILSAFQDWEEVGQGSFSHEKKWCHENHIKRNIMKNTFEVKKQLLKIMRENGFPEYSTRRKFLKNSGDDRDLNMLVTILSLGLDNMAVHKLGRKIATGPGNSGYIGKQSVNYPLNQKNVKYPFPLFVYGEKVFTYAISARQSTCINPAQLVLASKSISTDGNENVVINDWIPILMEQKDLENILKLRKYLESVRGSNKIM
jgi:ATP-dependent RNA helicase A